MIQDAQVKDGHPAHCTGREQCAPLPSAELGKPVSEQRYQYSQSNRIKAGEGVVLHTLRGGTRSGKDDAPNIGYDQQADCYSCHSTGREFSKNEWPCQIELLFDGYGP